MPTEHELRVLLGEIIVEVSGWSRDPLDTDQLIADWKRRGKPLYPFRPNWVIAPAATLAEWFEENHLDARGIAAVKPGNTEDQVAALEDVLARRPLTDRHAEILEHCTMVPAAFWLALEQNYRAGLAQGFDEEE